MTTTATAVLEDLHQRGIRIELADDIDLILRPTRLIDSDVVRIVRDHKPAIVRHLRLAAVGAERPDAETYLLDRLRAGTVWLNSTDGTLDREPNVGLIITTAPTPTGSRSAIKHTKLSAQFVTGFDAWHRLEDVLRQVLHYKGCVLADAGLCAVDSVVQCQECRERLA